MSSRQISGTTGISRPSARRSGNTRAPFPGSQLPVHGSQRRSVAPSSQRRHVLGERKRARLSIQAEQAAAGCDERGRVVLAGRVAVVGAEHERHAGGIDEREDLAVELRAGLALRLAEGRRVHRLRPQHRIGALPLDGVVGHREMGVEHLADDRTGALLAAQALVVDDVRLDESDAQRLAAGRWRGAERHGAIGAQQHRHQRRQGQRPSHRAQTAGPARERCRDRLVREQEHERESGHAAEIGGLSHEPRRIETVAEGVAEQPRHEPFGGDPGRRTGERTDRPRP